MSLRRIRTIRTISPNRLFPQVTGGARQTVVVSAEPPQNLRRIHQARPSGDQRTNHRTHPPASRRAPVQPGRDRPP